MNTTPNRVYGIDLGTTYSCIAYIDEFGKPQIIENLDGEQTTPSVVYFDGDEVVVGREAKNVSVMYPDRVVESVKRLMGTDETILIDGRSFRPEEISAYILRKVVGDAAQQIGQEIKDVVITCPAYFNISEREATKIAGQIAGLNVLAVINEPTAAALAYGLRSNQDSLAVIYDLGGGTFDVTLIKIQGNEFTVLETGGARLLGGKDWDARVVEYLAQCWQEEHGASEDPLDDPEVRQDLYNLAEGAKKRLTTSSETLVPVRYQGKSTRVTLTREKFDELTADLLEQTISLTKKLLDDAAAKGHPPFTEFLLVGGSTKMPQIEAKIREVFGVTPKFNRPDFAVAEGAAFHGQKLVLKEQIEDEIERGAKSEDEAIRAVVEKSGIAEIAIRSLHDIKITNITSHSFGIVADVRVGNNWTEKVVNLITRQTAVPVSVVRDTFGTREMHQRNLNLRVMENESDEELVEVADSVELGNAVMDLPEGLPTGSPIEIAFSLDDSGLLTMNAKLLADGRQINTTIQTTRIMSQEEIEQAKARSSAIQVR